MQEYKVKRRRFVFEGNELLRFSSSVPSLSDFSDISAFYEEISSNCERWCEEIKFPELCEKLKAGGKTALPRRMLYTLSANVTYSSEDIIEIHTEVSFSNSAREPAVQYSDTQAWLLSSQSLLPPKIASAMMK